MSYPDCLLHPGRVAELVCLSNECPKRLTLQCTVCINATCKRHNWKLMQEAIEEIFELCQNEQSRDEKRKKQGTQVETQQVSTKDEVQKLLAEFNKRLKMREEEIMANANLRAQGLLAKNNSPQQLYTVVRNKVNDFRKSNDRSADTLNDILNTLKPCIADDDGMLTFTTDPLSTGGILAPEVKDFENYLSSFLEGSRLLRSNSQQSPRKSQQGAVTERQMEELKRHYESQISGLIEQVKSIPILKSRIDAINMKLQAKDEKLKKYEQGGNNLQSPPTNPMKNSQFINEKVKQSESRAKRIQKLLEVREKLKSSMYNYAYTNPTEQVQLHKILRNQDAHSVQSGNVYTDEAKYLNLAMIVVADELNYLEYSEKEDNEPYIEAPILTKKGSDFKTTRPTGLGADRDPFFGGFGRPFGSTARSYFPSFY